MPFDFSLDFSPIANIGKTIQEAQQKEALKQAYTTPGPMNYEEMARRVGAAGDPANAMNLLQMGQRIQESGRLNEQFKQQLAESTRQHDLAIEQQRAALAETQRHSQATETTSAAAQALAEKRASPDYLGTIARQSADITQQYAPKTFEFTDVNGQKFTVEKGGAITPENPEGYRIPQVAGMPAADPNAMPGVDQQAMRVARAKQAVANEEAAVKDAKSAADFQPIIDQAITAYQRAIKAGAVGPYAGSGPARVLGKFNPLSGMGIGPNPEMEKARQDYDLARAALNAKISAIDFKNQGGVSNFERMMGSAQFPDLTAVDPDQGLNYLRQIQDKARQTITTGQIPALGQAPVVQGVMNRPSVMPAGAAPPAPGVIPPATAPVTVPPVTANPVTVPPVTAAPPAPAPAAAPALRAPNAALRLDSEETARAKKEIADGRISRADAIKLMIAHGLNPTGL